MNLALTDLIFRKELLEAFRDRKTILFMILLPILLYPVMGIGFFQIALVQVSKVKEETARVVFLGPAPPESFRKLLSTKGVILADIPTSPEAALLKGEVQALIEFPEGYEKTLERGGQIRVKIRYDDANERSAAAHLRIQTALAEFHQAILLERLKDQGLTEEFLSPIAENVESAATPERRAGYHLGRFLPYIILLMIVNGTMYPAIDITAGEKERGTLECLLAAPPTPLEIVLAKFAVVFFFGIVSAILNLASLGLTAASIFQSIRSLGTLDMLTLSISWETITITAVLMIPFTILFASLLVAIASFADSFKEAQIYIMPLFLVVVLPAVVSALPGTQLNGFWMVVPVTNLCLLMKELFLQQATVEQITVVFVCSCAYAGAALSLAVRLFSDEEVLFPSDQSFALFRGLGRIRRGGMSSPLSPKLGVSDAILAYALVFPLAYYSGTLVASWSPLGSLLLSQWGIILGVPLLLTLWGRLDYRRTFRLLMPKPQAFAGVLLTLVGSLVLIRFYGAWQERWLPSPPSIEENLLRILKDASGGYLLPLLFLGALTPAVCEECLCRGFILGGLRTRFSKWQSIFLSAVLFGALHMLIYQFIPTTLLGLLLAWFALETGSILPSILFHFLNNGITFAALHFSQYGESPPTGGESAKWGLAWLTQFSVPEMVRGPALIVVLAGAAGMLLAGCWIVRRAGRSNPENR